MLLVHGQAPRRVAVFRALQLGDLLCAVPALRALRSALPDASISLVGLPWAREFVRRFDRYVDGFIEFPGWPGLPEATFEPSRTLTFLREMQQEHFDLAIQLHGSGVRSNGFVAMLDAETSAGFYLRGQYCPDEQRYCLYPGRGSEVHRLLALTSHLGAAGDDALEFPIEEKDQAEYEALVRELGLRGGDYVCIHAGARDPRRRWSPAGFAAVSDALAAKGLRVLLTGSADEAPILEAVAATARKRVDALTGRTSLGALACLFDHAALLVTNDTGVSHIAAARRTPSVVLFSISDPRRWAPLNKKLHRPLRTIGQGGSALRPEQVIAEALEIIGVNA